MMQPQDVRLQKMLGLMEELSLGEGEMEAAESFLSGESDEKGLDALSFRDLSALSNETDAKFQKWFRESVGKGRAEDAQKLFAVIYAVGKSTAYNLIPTEMLTATRDPRVTLPPKKRVALFAEMMGNKEYWIGRRMLDNLVRVAERDPKVALAAMEDQKSQYDNGLLILYAAYFWMKYPHVMREERTAEGGGLLKQITNFLGGKKEGILDEEDQKRMKSYEDIIVDSLYNLFSKSIPAEELEKVKKAVDRESLPAEVRDIAARQTVSQFLLKLLGGCAFVNFTLSKRLENIVRICLAADVNGMLAVMENMDARNELRARGGGFDRLFGIDAETYIHWAALKKLDKVLEAQFADNRESYLACMKKADFETANYMLLLIGQNDPALFGTLKQNGEGAQREQVIRGLIRENTPAMRVMEAYLKQEENVEALYPVEDQLAGKSKYAGSREYGILEEYAKTYGKGAFYRRCLVYLLFRQAAYAFHGMLMKKGEVSGAEVKKLFGRLEEERLDLVHQLRAVSLITEIYYAEKWKNAFIGAAQEIFTDYLKNRREETLLAFASADAFGRYFGLLVLQQDPKQNRAEILSYSQDSSKLVKEELCRIIKEHREWEADVTGLLSSKKAADREVAVRALLSWEDAAFSELLKDAYEKEKNGKVRALMEPLFAAGDVQAAAKKVTGDDLVRQLHKGNKKRSLAWAYETPFFAVHKKSGEEAAEEYLQAILLCYVSMPAPGVSRDASLLAESLREDELAVYVNELFDKWMDAGAEAKKRWVMYAAAIHGGAEIVNKLHRQIQEWPQNARGAIAADAVSALALSPEPSALLIVDSISRKFKFKQVKAAAGKALEFAAAQLGLTREELADRIVPDLGFDENMEREFDYGERRFKVMITPALEIEVFDESGKRLKNMPAPGKRDEEEKAKKAYEDFRQMKKQMKTTVSSQKMRLEMALSTQRQWSVEAWKNLFVKNPVMHQFAIGLIWGMYENQSLVQSFRYMEDGSFNTEEEEEFEMPLSGSIGLVHPIELSEESRKAWQQQLEDYEITQPFEQLGRNVYYRTEEEEGQKSLERFGGMILNDLSLGGKLQTLGWYRGSVQDAGGFYTYYREDTELGLGVELHFSGSFVGGENEDVTVYDARFYRAGTIERGSYVYDEADQSKALPLREVPKRYFSEIVLQLTRATASSREKNEKWKDGR